MQINQYHGSYNRTKRTGSIEYLCVHYTADMGSAKNNCIYFSGGNRNASADYFVDDTSIWEYNDPSQGCYTWAVGDGKGAYGITNANSIHVEVVNTGSAFSDAEIEHLCELVPYLMEKYGIPADRVVRHWDASRKNCPAFYAGANNSAWTELHARITEGDNMNAADVWEYQIGYDGISGNSNEPAWRRLGWNNANIDTVKNEITNVDLDKVMEYAGQHVDTALTAATRLGIVDARVTQIESKVNNIAAAIEEIRQKL